MELECLSTILCPSLETSPNIQHLRYDALRVPYFCANAHDDIHSSNIDDGIGVILVHGIKVWYKSPWTSSKPWIGELPTMAPNQTHGSNCKTLMPYLPSLSWRWPSHRKILILILLISLPTRFIKNSLVGDIVFLIFGHWIMYPKNFG